MKKFISQILTVLPKDCKMPSLFFNVTSYEGTVHRE